MLHILLLVTMVVTIKARQCPDGTLAINGACVLPGLEKHYQSASLANKLSQTEPVCPIGTRQVSKIGEQIRCQSCPPGTYNPTPGATLCLSCPSGFGSLAGAKKCTSRIRSLVKCLPGQVFREGQCRCPFGMCPVNHGSITCLRRQPGEICKKGQLPP